MKKQISLLVVVLIMALGLSPPTFATPDFGTENHFTLEQATIDMDITIDVPMDLVPVMDFELSPEPIYLEGTVIKYPHLEEGYVLQLDQSALSQMYTKYRHDDNLCSLETMEISTIQVETITKEGPMRLELYDYSHDILPWCTE
jgi:hypothetical protein